MIRRRWEKEGEEGLSRTLTNELTVSLLAVPGLAPLRRTLLFFLLLSSSSSSCLSPAPAPVQVTGCASATCPADT